MPDARLGSSVAQHEMLLGLFFPQEYDPHLVQVHRYGDMWIALNLFPRLLHTLAPMDIIQHHYGIIVRLFQALLEIIKRGILCVVTVYEGQVKPIDPLQNLWKLGAETPENRNDITLFQKFEMMLCDPGRLRATFNGMQSSLICTRGQIECRDPE